MQPWLMRQKPLGRVVVRFHTIDLLDSMVEIDCSDCRRLACDLNFGEGV
jgi:hypothetical protein